MRGALVAGGAAAAAAILWIWLASASAPRAAPESTAAMDNDGIRDRGAPRPATVPEKADGSVLGVDSKNPTARPAAPPIAASDDESWSPADPVGIVVFGAVRDDEGSALHDTSVTFRSEDGRERTDRIWSAPTYSVNGLSPGTWSVSIREQSCAPFEQTLTLEAKPKFRRVDLTLHRLAAIEIHFVTPSGAPLAEALAKEGFEVGTYLSLMAYASKDAPAGSLPKTTGRGHARSAIGEYEDYYFSRVFGKKPTKGVDGQLRISIAPPYHVSAIYRHLVVSTQRIDRPVRELALVVDPKALLALHASARVQVVDGESGAAIAGAHVNVGNRQGGGTGAQTDGRGIAMIERIVPGPGVVEVGAPGYAGVSQFYEIEAGAAVDLGVVRLTKPTTMEGIVVDRSGRPVEGYVFVRYPDPTQTPHPSDLGFSSSVPADGTFRFEHVARGKHVVTFGNRSKDSPLASLPTVVDTTAGPVTGIRIVAEPARTLVLDGSGAPNRQPLCVVTTADGIVAWADPTYGGKREISLPAGSYVVTIHAESVPPRSIPVAVGDSPAIVTIGR